MEASGPLLIKSHEMINRNVKIRIARRSLSSVILNSCKAPFKILKEQFAMDNQLRCLEIIIGIADTQNSNP